MKHFASQTVSKLHRVQLVFQFFLSPRSKNWLCRSTICITPLLKQLSLSNHSLGKDVEMSSIPPPPADKHRNLRIPECYHDSFSSPSFLNASLRDSSVAPFPENCTVMLWGRNMLDLFLWSRDKALCAALWGEMMPW